MPKIIYYDSSKDFEVQSTILSSPKEWFWNNSYMYRLFQNSEYEIFGDFSNNDNIQYGLYIDGQVVSGITFNLKNNIPIIENVTTDKKFRNKGYAKVLYSFILNKYGILISDSKVFTSSINKIDKSLGIWVNYLSSLAILKNFNIISKTISDFNHLKGNTEVIRFVATTSDENLKKLSYENLCL